MLKLRNKCVLIKLKKIKKMDMRFHIASKNSPAILYRYFIRNVCNSSLIIAFKRKAKQNQQQNLLLSFNMFHGDQAIKKPAACNWYSDIKMAMNHQTMKGTMVGQHDQGAMKMWPKCHIKSVHDDWLHTKYTLRLIWMGLEHSERKLVNATRWRSSR
jgi:hypothetical protein